MPMFDANEAEPEDFQPGIATGPLQPLPILLLLDVSSSMQGEPINELNRALVGWERELKRDEQLQRHGEIAIITFGGRQAEVVSGSSQDADGAFEPVATWRAPKLSAGGVTPMVEAISMAMTLAVERRTSLSERGVLSFRPNVFMITDGRPTDAQGHPSEDWRRLVPEIRAAEERNRLLFFALGVTAADEAVLRGLAPEAYYKTRDIQFRQLLRLVSTSSGSALRGDDARMTFQRVRKMFLQGAQWTGQREVGEAGS
jgi:uncharacterized protein YegL